ncbi:MAG: sorbosone dehydrogenase family protein, partial [Gammaproteobacteria bacterium]|nr:sorbosone dehydrogenase family protein [Gammaproteobacteria bacterium]
MIRKTTLALCAPAVLAFAAGGAHADFDIGEIRLPPGFEIEEYVSGLRNARGLAIGENGTLFVGTRNVGKVYAVRDPGGPGQEVIELASRLILPNGVAVRGSSLFVAEVHRILEYENIEQRLGEGI